MKDKISLNIIVFALTFLVSFVLVTTFFNKNTFASFNTETSFKAKVKVYNFLMADKARYAEYNRKSLETRLQPRPDAMSVLLKEREILLKTLYQERANADTSELPEDFRAAWGQYLIGQKILLDMIYSKEKQKTESVKAAAEEIYFSENEFRRVVNNYGFNLTSSSTILD